MYLCIQSATAAVCVAILLLLQLAAAACCCCSSSSAGWKNCCCCGSLHLIQVFSFSSFKHDLIFMCPLAVLRRAAVAFTASICCSTSSVIAGMRGARAGISPPRRIPGCIRKQYDRRGSLISLSVVCCLSGLFFRVIIDCKSCRISTNPSSKEAGDLGLTRGTNFVARRLELASVAALLRCCVAWVRQ